MTARARNARVVLDALRALRDVNPDGWWSAITVHAFRQGPLTLGQTQYELGRLPDVERRRPEPRDFTVYRLRGTT